MNPQDAIFYIDEAIEALSVESYRAPADGDPEDGLDWSAVPSLESTIAIELERIDSALGPRGQSMFYPLAENIKQAMAALHGARDALTGNDRTSTDIKEG